MNKKSKGLLSIASAMLIGASLSTTAVMAKEETAAVNPLAEGKKLSFERKKGNCLACHMIKDGVAPGNIAPPLIVMKTRFPDREVLKSQIYDASKKNPETIMPLFGRYEVLSADELDKVVDYIHSL